MLRYTRKKAPTAPHLTPMSPITWKQETNSAPSAPLSKPFVLNHLQEKRQLRPSAPLSKSFRINTVGKTLQKAPLSNSFPFNHFQTTCKAPLSKSFRMIALQNHIIFPWFFLLRGLVAANGTGRFLPTACAGRAERGYQTPLSVRNSGCPSPCRLHRQIWDTPASLWSVPSVTAGKRNRVHLSLCGWGNARCHTINSISCSKRSRRSWSFMSWVVTDRRLREGFRRARPRTIRFHRYLSTKECGSCTKSVPSSGILLLA